MRIVGVPYGLRREPRLWSLPLGDMRMFRGAARDGETVGDLGATDHLLIYPSSRILYRPRGKLRCKVSLLLSEPRGGHTQFYRTLPLLWWRFFRVFTHDPRLLRWLPNGRHLPYGTTWVPTDGSFEHAKTRRMSLIASHWRKLEGHRLRHRLADWIKETGQDVDLLGLAYKPLENKAEGLAPYRFSLVIENSREPGYFTEKLLDALFCDAVPIYWGAPDIGQYFDTRGMVICETEDALRKAAAGLSVADYERCMAFMPENRRRAMAYVDYEANAGDVIRREAA